MLLLEAGARVGVLNTIGLCVVTGFVGASLARSQGASVIRRSQAIIAEGGVPAAELLDGMMILVAGVVLLTPGFVTDALGLLLLFPPTRVVIRWVIKEALQSQLATGTWTVMRDVAGHTRAQWRQTQERDKHGPQDSAPEYIPPQLAPRPPGATAKVVIDIPEAEPDPNSEPN